MNQNPLLLIGVVALAVGGCTAIRPKPVLEGEGVRYQSFGRVGMLEIIAASQSGRRQVNVVCHDDPGANTYHPSPYRITRMIAQLEEMLASKPMAPGASQRIGEVAMPIFGKQGTPKMTFGIATPDRPGAVPFFEVDCYDAFVDQTQHYDLTRSETERLRELFVEARAWLAPD